MSNTNSKGTAVTQDDFDAIKTLVNAGVSFRQTAKIVQRAGSTVNQIAKADSLEHYIELCRQARMPKVAKNTVAERITTPESTNEAKFVEAVVKLTDAIDRLCEILEEPTPLEREAKAFKLFNRG